jgi:hypothetical protein
MVLPDSYLGSEQGHKQAPEQSAFECLQLNATITEFTRNLLLRTRFMSLHKSTNMYKIQQRDVMYRAYSVTAWIYQNQNCYGTMLAASWRVELSNWTERLKTSNKWTSFSSSRAPQGSTTHHLKID